MPSAKATSHGRFSLFGPVLLFDLIRDGRRSRLVLLRCVYLIVLLIVLGWLYLDWFDFRGGWEDLFESGSVTRERLAQFATKFFFTFLTVQFVVVGLLTPAYTAGAIAEEKERKTLDYLLATDLSSREIVLGKLGARMARLLLLLMAGLPVLALTPFWGGVDPQLVLAGFAATGLTMLSLASISILNSVYAPKPIDALMRTYFQAMLFLFLGPCIPGVNVGHPIFAITLVGDSWLNSASQGWSLLWILGGYGLVHLTIATVCIGVAIVNLRRVALGGAPAKPATARPRPPLLLGDESLIIKPTLRPNLLGVKLPPPRRRLPLIAENPLLWKELYLEQHFSWERAHPLLAMLLVFVGVCVGSIGFTLVLIPLGSGHSVSQPVNVWLRGVGTCIAVVLLLVKGFYAAATVSREREKQTLDGLLTMPEGREPILFAKWIGSLLSTRQAWWCLGLIWIWGLLTGGLHILALPLVLLATAIYAAFMASLGLYCSTVCRTTLRATLWTFVATGGLVGLTWMFAGASDAFLTLLPGPLGVALRNLFAYGLALPMPLIVLAFRYDGFWSAPDLTSPEILMAALAGLVIYAVAAWAMFRLAVRAFRRRG